MRIGLSMRGLTLLARLLGGHDGSMGSCSKSCEGIGGWNGDVWVVADRGVCFGYWVRGISARVLWSKRGAGQLIEPKVSNIA